MTGRVLIINRWKVFHLQFVCAIHFKTIITVCFCMCYSAHVVIISMCVRLSVKFVCIRVVLTNENPVYRESYVL